MYAICGYAWQVGAIAISPNGQFLASGDRDKAIVLWQL
ncbi:WD40 repeat domain-containing protein [Chroococcidiopsis cubana]|nr:WD40 repeat domain-containing protein [Chroococcidiopsis cubana]